MIAVSIMRLRSTTRDCCNLIVKSQIPASCHEKYSSFSRPFLSKRRGGSRDYTICRCLPKFVWSRICKKMVDHVKALRYHPIPAKTQQETKSHFRKSQPSGRGGAYRRGGAFNKLGNCGDRPARSENK